VFAQDKKHDVSKLDKTKKVELVDAACGQCRFGLKTQKGCDLAVRIKDQAYFVDGTKIDEHGDAHADDGFCNAVRKAKVQGEIKNGRFAVTYFKLIPDSTNN
jgi:hypothetical protein